MTSIQKSIWQLVQQRKVGRQFHKDIVKIAGAHLRDALAKGLHSDITAEDLAGDFIVAIAGEEITSEITTPSQLGREFKRWLTRRDKPEQAELWQILSRSILLLERAGRVERPLAQRRFHNTNKTSWYISGAQDAKVHWEAEDEIARQLPSSRMKSDHDRILKPDEAEDMILIILRLFQGPIPFGLIFRNICKKLPLFTTDSLDASLPGAMDGKSRSLQDIVEGRDVPVYHEMIIAEQAEALAVGIWESAGKIERGGQQKIEGRHILCCYLIPKHTSEHKIVLDSFGPTSTVQDLVTDLEALLREKLSDLGSRGASSVHDEHIRHSITRGLIERIGAFCSEKGYCRSFYDKWKVLSSVEGNAQGGGA